MSTGMSRNVLDRIAILRTTDLFGSLSEQILRTVVASFINRSLDRGEILYSEHDDASALYVVGRGVLRSVRLSVDGREQVLSTERPGAILAAVAIFGGGKFYSTLIADTPAEVLAIPRHQALDLCRTHPELLWNLAKVLANKLRHSAELIETLALRQVDQRVAQYLLTVCHQRGIEAHETCIVELTMNRSEIASRIGSAREVVSRAFTQLEKAGLIQLQGRRLVTIPDMRSLRSFAGADSPLKKPPMVSELSSDIV
ncbi:MAG TPA: Crp/Fnr family transcriptional regulator [Bryobacteraceae bacterium]|nr:Crp/Fnr family transcriptional regulator [Bryobacteraceae bacterium]